MPTSFALEELDAPTQEYVLAIRDRQGRGMPGAYVPVGTVWPLLGCGCGPVVVIVTLVLTLTTAVNVVYDDPSRVAVLQTAGLLLGGWMFVTAFRAWAKEKSPKTAGSWAYADALHLYQATGERVRVTPLGDMTFAEYKHRYSDNKYQNTSIKLLFPGGRFRSLVVEGETQADQFVRFLNYLVYSRGPGGGNRAALSPLYLGALAAHVARTDTEPKDYDGNLDLNLVSLDWQSEVPTCPERVRRSPPSVLPYIVLIVAGAGCYLVMREVNVPLRDDAIYEAVTKEPVEPRYLRAYLIDGRNIRHRGEVTTTLTGFYDPVIAAVRQRPGNDPLKGGFIQVLDSLRTADEAIVSVRVTEVKAPGGANADASTRAAKVQDTIASRTARALTPLSRPINIPPGVEIKPPPPPVGEQLLAFVQAPADAPNPHFDIRYAFEPDKEDGRYRLVCQVAIRVNVEDPPVASRELTLPQTYSAADANAALTDLAGQIVKGMTGG